MPDALFESTKLTAYYLWEQTGCHQALRLWYCAEDIACFLEQASILDIKSLEGIAGQEPNTDGYIWFVRHIAFRLHVFTDNPDELANWYAAERLLASQGWAENVLNMSAIMRSYKDKGMAIDDVRSENVRAHYAK